MEFLSSSYEQLWPMWTRVVFVQLCFVLFGVVFHTLSSCYTWCNEFGNGVKYERWHEKCPSNSQRPAERPEKEEKNAIRTAVSKRRPSITDKITTNPTFARESPQLLRRGRASPVILPSGPSGPVHLSPKVHRNSAHDMDHIRIKFLDYLWVSFFVGPNAVLLWVTGILRLMVRQVLHRRGWLSPKPCDPRRVVGRLILESMEVMHFTGEWEEDGDTIATFCWPDFPILQENGSIKIMELLTVDINLTTKLMVRAKIDQKLLTPRETITLIYFHSSFVDHVKLHAYANWGVNDNIPNKFVRRMSAITVVYNYYGYTVFKRLAAFWYFCGLCKHNYCDIPKVINHGLKEGTVQHSKLRKFLQHSQIVNFVMKVRNGFMNTFRKYRDELHGIDGEAMFIGTILHSLDHTLLEWNLEDALWLDTESREYGAMAEICRFARVGFVPDIPALLFSTRYKDAPHPFYQEVYKHASRVDQRLADHMDACIVK